ncbi:MAG: hypothetical protein ABR600_11210 [Actinomycetota bacterium]
MHDGWGIALIVAGAVVALGTAFGLRTRASAPVVGIVLLACGLSLGTGALLVQDDVSRTNWVVTVVLMSVLAPAHVRVVLGPFGRSGDEPRPTTTGR